MTMRALEAANTLHAEGVDVAVLHSPTIKPLDEEILKEASRNGRVVVAAENHSIIGGLGEAVAGLCYAPGWLPPFRQIALPDAFLDAGALPTLHERYGISADAVARSIKGGCSPASPRLVRMRHAAEDGSNATRPAALFAALLR